MSSDWIFFPCFFGMVSFVVWVVVNGWQRRQQVKLIVEFNNRVLERLGSAQDFSDFLRLAGWHALGASAALDRDRSTRAHHRARRVHLADVHQPVTASQPPGATYRLTTRYGRARPT